MYYGHTYPNRSPQPPLEVDAAVKPSDFLLGFVKALAYLAPKMPLTPDIGSICGETSEKMG